MKAISLFSGVGGFDLGFERAGIETVLQAEQDPHCLEVLARHWPDTERVTDVRDVAGPASSFDSAQQEWSARAGVAAARDGVDLIYGGFPCQDVSVAGKRAGLGGERSGLWFEFERVLRELRPRWTVIENVPGLLSSNRGDDFAVILGALDELRFDVAWAVLDAQHFGVPQRRRRVFIVGGPSRRSVEQVLSLCESCGGNPETGRAQGEGIAGTLGGGAGERGLPPDTDRMTFIEDTISTIQTQGPGAGQEADKQSIVTLSGVRRLTPLECERLQGFPDNWTEGLADSHRYRQMGNAVCVPVAEWIGHRLMAVNA